jgi:predicted nucleotidyltransferase
MSALADLARDVGVDERTLRRAVAQGTLRGTRPSPRKLDLPLSERRYVRRSWPLLAALRAALRTEPNVRFALLFGSAATGEDTPESDVDLLVSLRDPDLFKLIALEGRLSERLGRDVELVRLEDAERDPVFFALGLEQGRTLVDRVGIGPRLRRRAARLTRDEPRREARRARTAIGRIRELCAS